MFGYATDETEECMPLTILLAHKLNFRMKQLSLNGECPWIRPDSKSQVNHSRVIKDMGGCLKSIEELPGVKTPTIICSIHAHHNILPNKVQNMLSNFCCVKSLVYLLLPFLSAVYYQFQCSAMSLSFDYNLMVYFLQVTVEYKDNMGAMEPLRVHTVVISVQHSPNITLEEIRHNLLEKVVKVIIPAKYLDNKTIYHLLPSGKFLMGGPQVGN